MKEEKVEDNNNKKKNKIIIIVIVILLVLNVSFIYWVYSSENDNPYDKTYTYTLKDSINGTVYNVYLELSEDYCAFTFVGLSDKWIPCSVSQNSAGEYIMNYEGSEGEYKYIDGNFVCDECTTMENFKYSGELES